MIKLKAMVCDSFVKFVGTRDECSDNDDSTESTAVENRRPAFIGLVEGKNTTQIKAQQVSLIFKCLILFQIVSHFNLEIPISVIGK